MLQNSVIHKRPKPPENVGFLTGRKVNRSIKTTKSKKKEKLKKNVERARKKHSKKKN